LNNILFLKAKNFYLKNISRNILTEVVIGQSRLIFQNSVTVIIFLKNEEVRKQSISSTF